MKYLIFIVFLLIYSQIKARESFLKNDIKFITNYYSDTIKYLPDNQTITDKTSGFTRQLYLKTNAIEWGMLISNITIELDLHHKWSFALPISYSDLNYFSTSIKFKTFSVRPEIRYWISDVSNDKWFIGAHLGLIYYNYASGGEWRYQDHKGKSPALGGGVSVGYRMPLRKSSNWNIEYALGAGVYKLHYDKFYNYNNGSLHSTYKETYFGIDNISISLSYMFGLKNKL